jgi:hypothetical protein
VSDKSWDLSKLGRPPHPAAAWLLCWRWRRTKRPGPEPRKPRRGRPLLLEAMTETTQYRSVAEAVAAGAQVPCDGPDGWCSGEHGVVFTDERGRIRVRRIPKPKATKEKRG